MIELHIHHQGQNLRTLTLEEGTFSVGNMGSDIELKYPTVSRTHGQLCIDSQKVMFTDLGSKNGSFFKTSENNFERLKQNLPFHWTSGTKNKIVVGPFELFWNEPSTTQSVLTFQILDASRLYSKLLSETPLHAQERLREMLSRQLNAKDVKQICDTIYFEFHQNGPVDEYLSNPLCREIIINAYHQIYVDLGRGLFKTEKSFISTETYNAWIQRTAAQMGRRLDLQNPICEATLENGSRLHAVLPPISAQSVSVAIRKFGSAPIDLKTALDTRWVEQSALDLLIHAVHSKMNVLISGGTSTGKTSLLNFLCTFLHEEERILTVEDTVELKPPVKNLVQLQARKPNADGIGLISLRELVQCALRMRPDRIIVGECRGPEVLDMLQVMNTGHPGSLTTIHANSTKDALNRLELLALLGSQNLAIEAIQKWIHSTIDLIVQVHRDDEGHRFVKEIYHREKGMVYYRENFN